VLLRRYGFGRCFAVWWRIPSAFSLGSLAICSRAFSSRFCGVAPLQVPMHILGRIRLHLVASLAIFGMLSV